MDIAPIYNAKKEWPNKIIVANFLVIVCVWKVVTGGEMVLKTGYRKRIWGLKVVTEEKGVTKYGNGRRKKSEIWLQKKNGSKIWWRKLIGISKIGYGRNFSVTIFETPTCLHSTPNPPWSDSQPIKFGKLRVACDTN